MATQKFFAYGLGGDRYKMELTEKGDVFLIHETSTGEPVTVERIDDDSDEETILNGLRMIDSLVGGLPHFEDATRVAKEGLLKARNELRKDTFKVL